MATLTKKQKEWIVDRLACFDGPTDVAQAFEKEFGISIDKAQVANYNAAKKGPRQRMADELVTLFDVTREEYRTETKDIAIASKAHRLRQLDRIVNNTKSPKLQMEAMEQAAKEVGDVYTNRRVHSGNLTIDWGALSDDQLDQLAAGADPAEVL